MIRRRSRTRRPLLLGLLLAAMVLVAAVALADGLGGKSARATHYVNAATLSHPRTPGHTLFSSGFQDGFSSWHLQSLPGRARIVHGHAYQGATNARFEVRPGDVEPETGSARSEVSGPTFSDGQDLYVRDAIRIPGADTFRGPWQIVQQLHESDWSGSPGLALFLTSGLHLRLGAGDGSPMFWTSGRLRRDRWYDVVYRVRLSQDPSVGFVEVWVNGKRQRLAGGHYRSHGQTIQASHSYLKLGIYRAAESSGTSVVEQDDVVVVARPR